MTVFKHSKMFALIMLPVILLAAICPAAMAVSFTAKANGSAKVYLSSGSTAKIASGTTMTVTACKNGWAAVKKNGQKGYMKTADIKPNTGSTNGNAAAWALMQLGKSYGNNEPSSFNCSSLVNYCYGKCGKSVPSTAKRIAADSSMTCVSSTGSLKIGDILCFDTDEDGTCDHVAIFIGDGEFVEASQSKDKVQVNDLDSWYRRHFICARRP